PYGAEFLPQNQNPQTNTALNDNYFRPYPGYNGVPQQIYQGNSSYHSLQVTANRRFARGVQFGLSFTHSKAMGYADGDSTSTSGTPTGKLQRRRHVSKSQGVELRVSLLRPAQRSHDQLPV